MADLIGDYVFSDPEFVRNLSVSNRNLFQKLYDEIKYLAKVATAGSKEARALEKVKKTFADVYRETKNTAQPDGVKFSFGVTQSDIDLYVDAAYANKNQKDFQKYAQVSPKLQNAVQPEINIDGYAHALRDNDIRHIRNSHGEHTNEKYPVTKQDIKKIPWLVENYDKVYVVRRDDGRTGIIYVKVNEQGIVYYLEQATTKYGNEPLLINKQMIKTGINDIPNLPGLKDAITKKQSEIEFLDDLKKIQQVYVQDDYQSHSNEKISQMGVNVNGKMSLSTNHKDVLQKDNNAYGRDVAVESREETVPAAKRSKVDYSKVAPTKEDIALMEQEKASQSEDGMQTLIRGLDKIRIFPNVAVVFTIFLW